MQRILITFTGFHDPYTRGIISEGEHIGPILTLCNEVKFDKVILFDTPNTNQNTQDTASALQSLHPDIIVEIYNLNIVDPIDYSEILVQIRNNLTQVQGRNGESEFFVSVTSGTPQMHASWLLIIASGEFPAKLLNIRPKRFVTKESPLVTEFDFSSPDFPVVRSNVSTVSDETIESKDIDGAISTLGIIGDDREFLKQMHYAIRVADQESPVLILGETGTGKDLIARLIHLLSSRSNNKYLPVNCSTLPENLSDSILFGHVRGAFTGASSDKEGLFEAVNGGTLFLDEIADLPLQTQTKLLRVLQDGEIQRLGSNDIKKVDVRIIAATNKDLAFEIENNNFREDLFYRLGVGVIQLPPLRNRSTDIPKIAMHLLDKINKSLKKPKNITPKALMKLQNHSWPGNIRDLENVLERSIIYSNKDILDSEDILLEDPVFSRKRDTLKYLPEPSEDFDIEVFISNVRKHLMKRAVEKAENNKSKAARLLGISPQAVHKYFKK